MFCTKVDLEICIMVCIIFNIFKRLDPTSLENLADENIEKLIHYICDLLSLYILYSTLQKDTKHFEKRNEQL